MTDWELFLRLRLKSPAAELNWRGTRVDDEKVGHLLLEAVAGVLSEDWQEFLDPFLFSKDLTTAQIPECLAFCRNLHQLGRKVGESTLKTRSFRDRSLLLFLMTDNLLQDTDPISCLYGALHQKLPDQRLLEVFEQPEGAGFLVENGRLTQTSARDWRMAGEVHALFRSQDPGFLLGLEEFAEHCLKKARPVEAEFLFRRMQNLEEAREKPLPREKQACCLAAIGRAIRAQHRWPEAEPMLSQAAELFAEMNKPGNLKLAQTLTELAYGYETDGDLDEAVSLWRRAGGIYSSVLKPDDPRMTELREALERLG